ncbi:MAG: hypothetical protein F6K09_28255, partial [Merismopedia sp. SIO2A8]|nr:hypothetical protein [Merismopedia sp. SIO2A8]
MLRRANQASTTRKRSRWFEKIMAAIALLNFLLVLLDYSYVPFRDHYLQAMPNLTTWYGEQFKGIVPERTTATYLKTVGQLKGALSNHEQVDPLLLASLRQQSRTIINE